MPLTTDPAREFTDFCKKLRTADIRPGGETLAFHFGVDPWSTDFMIIMACIHRRISDLCAMVNETDLDSDIKQTALDCLANVRNAFALSGLSNQWGHSTKNFLNDASLNPIMMMSAFVRPKYGYTVPIDDEIDELLADINQLLTWLKNHELGDRDFIRCAIIEGLENFVFRVERVGWFGWPDTMDSLKNVIAAYLAMERGRPEPNVSPPYEAMIKMVSEGISSVFDRVKYIKDVSEVGDWLLRGYGAICATGLNTVSISGLLTHTTQ